MLLRCLVNYSLSLFERVVVGWRWQGSQICLLRHTKRLMGYNRKHWGGLASNFAHEDALSREFAVPKSRGIIEKLDELRKK